MNSLDDSSVRAAAQSIEQLLPQTQCTRCGYSGCKPYAEAIASGEAQINQCPPGGLVTIRALAKLLGRAPLEPANAIDTQALIAQIDEERCIGCAKCLSPCPVDAIIGARKRMHTVVANLCTGCQLCIAPCPVDCIAMVPRQSLSGEPSPQLNRERFEARNVRLARHAREAAALLSARKQAAICSSGGDVSCALRD